MSCPRSAVPPCAPTARALSRSAAALIHHACLLGQLDTRHRVQRPQLTETQCPALGQLQRHCRMRGTSRDATRLRPALRQRPDPPPHAPGEPNPPFPRGSASELHPAQQHSPLTAHCGQATSSEWACISSRHQPCVLKHPLLPRLSGWAGSSDVPPPPHAPSRTWPPQRWWSSFRVRAAIVFGGSASIGLAVRAG